jgi:hypothetical protein
MKSSILWDITLCSLFKVNWLLDEYFIPPFAAIFGRKLGSFFDPEDGGYQLPITIKVNRGGNLVCLSKMKEKSPLLRYITTKNILLQPTESCYAACWITASVGAYWTWCPYGWTMYLVDCLGLKFQVLGHLQQGSCAHSSWCLAETSVLHYLQML